jgi:hypothetical protein
MRWAWAAAAAIFVVGLAVLVLLRGGPPELIEGHTVEPGDAQLRRNANATDGSDPEATLLLRYETGKEASFTLTVRNEGKHRVRLTGAYVLGRNLMFAARPARFEPAPGELRKYDFTPATAVDLGPGREVAVVLTGRFTNCNAYEPGSETSTRTLSVDYRDGDATRTLDIPLRDEIRVTAPGSCGQ